MRIDSALAPGAPILRSYDLVNWEYAGHSVPSLDFGSAAYNLTGGRAYVKGIWASTLNYRPSNSTYYWLGCTEFNRTYVYTASAVDGAWTKRARINNCYYDAGLLVDEPEAREPDLEVIERPADLLRALGNDRQGALHDVRRDPEADDHAGGHRERHTHRGDVGTDTELRSFLGPHADQPADALAGRDGREADPIVHAARRRTAQGSAIAVYPPLTGRMTYCLP